MGLDVNVLSRGVVALERIANALERIAGRVDKMGGDGQPREVDDWVEPIRAAIKEAGVDAGAANLATSMVARNLRKIVGG